MPRLTCDWTWNRNGEQRWTGAATAQNYVTASDQFANNILHGKKIIFCPRGIEIEADVRVHDYKQYYGSTFDVGFVQILESSTMKAIYGLGKNSALGKTVVHWKQEQTPCYDADDANIPWYDLLGGRADVTAQGAVYKLALKDYPMLNVDAYLHRPGHPNNNHPLLYAIKRNQFSVYMMMRERLNNFTKHRWIVKHGGWRTEIEIKANSNWAGNRHGHAGYKLMTDTLTVKKTGAWPGALALFSVPHKSTGGANQHQRTNTRAPHYPMQVFWDLK